MSQIVGNRQLCEKLCRDVLEDKLSHAYILEGKRGTGKHTVAKYVAAALACECGDGSRGEFPCCTCPECRKVLDGDCPDLITVGLQDKATIGVDTVRFLREDVRLVPNDLDFKIYIIEDADKMTHQAQNALLLTLEEPPAYVSFFLLCENSDLLLETIRSRAPIIRTQPIANEDIDAYLCQRDMRAAQMKLSDPKGFAELIVASKNGIGAALDFLDPKTFAPVKERRATARELLNAATSADRPSVIIPMLLRFPAKRDQLTLQLEALSEAINDLVMLKTSDGVSLRFFSDTSEAMEMCDRVSMSFLYTFGQAVICATDSIGKNANVRLTMIKLATDAGLI